MKYVFGCKIYVFSVFLLLIFIGLGLSCSDLHFNESNCVRDSEGQCRDPNDIAFLHKEPMDLLIVLDNSYKAQELNPHITANLNQFLQCIKPIDWKVGLISGVYNGTKKESFGQLMRLKVNGSLSLQNSLDQHRDHYSNIFNDTISLKSDCSTSSFCEKGTLQPLSAVKAFMGKSQENGFLREQTPLSVIIISSSEKQKRRFIAKKPTSNQELSSVLQEDYYGDFEHFMSLAALPPGTYDDCVRTRVDVVVGGVKAATQIGKAYALHTVDPMALIASAMLEDIVGLFGGHEKTYEIAQFAQQTGGQVVDLCSPHFGKALAYLLFQKLEIQDKFPNECLTMPVSNNKVFAER